MKRRIKKRSAIYEYLQSTGLLEHGIAEEIVAAKKMYWASVRKAWKQAHRNEHKSYTIFFSGKEQRLFENAADKMHISINSFIKNTCINALINRPNIDNKTIGAIREALVNFHTELQLHEENSNRASYSADIILNKFAMLEKNILSLLQHKYKDSF